MLSYHTLKDKPRVLRAFTSLERDEFETLLIPFEQAWNAYVTNPLRHKKARKRRYGGGRKPHLLAIEDKLFFHFVLPQSLSLARSHCGFLWHEPGTGQRVDS